MDFELTSEYKPTGDQPEAIKALVEGILRGDKAQTLLGVTGSGKNLYDGQCHSTDPKADPGIKS